MVPTALPFGPQPAPSQHGEAIRANQAILEDGIARWRDDAQRPQVRAELKVHIERLHGDWQEEAKRELVMRVGAEVAGNRLCKIGGPICRTRLPLMEAFARLRRREAPRPAEATTWLVQRLGMVLHLLEAIAGRRAAAAEDGQGAAHVPHRRENGSLIFAPRRENGSLILSGVSACSTCMLGSARRARRFLGQAHV